MLLIFLMLSALFLHQYPHSEVERQTNNMLNSFISKRHIVNLGHGVYPDIDPEKVKTFINTVKNYELKH